MTNENYPTPEIQHAVAVSKFIQEESSMNDKTALIAMAYAIFNKLSKTGELDHCTLNRKLDKMGDFSSKSNTMHADPCFETLSIVAAVFAGLYEDPTHGATRFHRHDQCPEWSKNLRPSALLGPHFYYRD